MAISLAALACGLLAIGMGVVLLFGPDDGKTGSASPDADVTPAQDATVVHAASTTPEAVSPPPWLTGTLKIGGDIPLPDQLAVLSGQTPFGKSGIAAWGIRRVSSALPQGVGVADIGGAGPSGGLALSFAQDESGVVFASICRPVECASEGFDPATKFTTTFYRSNDGGLSWNATGSRPGQWFVRAAVNNEAVAVSFEGSSQWILVDSNRAIRRPEDAGELDLVIFRGEIAWLHRELPIVISESGSTRYKLDLGQPLTARIVDIVAPSNGEMAVLWMDPAIPEKRFLTVRSRDGERVRTLDAENAIVRLFGFTPGLTGPGLALLVGAFTGVYPGTCPEDQLGYGMSPAIVEVDPGRMAFIRELLVDTKCPAGGTWAFASWQGGFARIDAPSSCLSVRQQPGLDAAVLECVADGALLILAGSTTEADGTRWTAIRTLGGRAGWVAREFLELPLGPGN